jgi:DNA (cytosine-5)-methyltransferase 1
LFFVADADGERAELQQPRFGTEERPAQWRPKAIGRSGEGNGAVADAECAGLAQRERQSGVPGSLEGQSEGQDPADANSAWSDAEWIVGADGKARRVKPGLRLLAHGIPGRVGLLRGFGNAIVPPLAAEFVRAAREARLAFTMSNS